MSYYEQQLHSRSKESYDEDDESSSDSKGDANCLDKSETNGLVSNSSSIKPSANLLNGSTATTYNDLVNVYMTSTAANENCVMLNCIVVSYLKKLCYLYM